MNTKNITALLAIAQLALELHNANNATTRFKREYHEKLDEFERDVRILPLGRLDKWDVKNCDFIEFTLVEYNAYRKARLAAYNVKRRLENACRKFRSIDTATCGTTYLSGEGDDA